jgi:hypothetical protein
MQSVVLVAIVCGRGSQRFVHATLRRCRVREISTNVLVAGTDLVLRLANAEADSWEHCLGPSYEIRISYLKTFLQWNIEDAPVDG